MRIKILLFFLLLTSPLPAKGPKTYGALYVSEIISVIDGDTIKVNIDHIHPLIGERIPVRLAGIDTPELSSPNPHIKALALKAKAFTENALKNSNRILLTNLRRDKYFRLLADLQIDGISLSEMLLDAGLARPYHGGEKPDWTKQTF